MRALYTLVAWRSTKNDMFQQVHCFGFATLPKMVEPLKSLAENSSIFLIVVMQQAGLVILDKHFLLLQNT